MEGRLGGPPFGWVSVEETFGWVPHPMGGFLISHKKGLGGPPFGWVSDDVTL